MQTKITHLDLECYVCTKGICHINSRACFACKGLFCLVCSKKLFKNCKHCSTKFCEACAIGFADNGSCLYCRPKTFGNRLVFGLIGNKIRK